MSTAHVIQTVIEVLVAVALIVGFFFEPVVATWERKQGEKILRAFNKRKGYKK